MNNQLAPHELHKIHQDGGVPALQTEPMLEGASTPAQNALIHRQNAIQHQQTLNNGKHSGGKRMKKRMKKTKKIMRKMKKLRGGNGVTDDNIPVPSFPPKGAQVSGGEQTTTNINSGAIGNLLTVHAQSQYDSVPAPVEQSGGNCNSNNGLIINGQPWNCMSGGIVKKTKKSKKSKKSKKTKKNKKTKKSKKTKKNKKQ